MTEEKVNYARLYEKDLGKLPHLYQKFFINFLFLPFARIFYNINVSGRENLPEKTGYICAGNHISYFDPFLAAVATKSPLAYMAKKELFENKICAFHLRHLAAFAVNREKLEVSTIKTVKHVFKTGTWNMGIFPQGGIRKNKTIEKVNKGFVVIAKMSKANIIPMSITGVEKYNWNPFKKATIDIKFGTLISYEKNDDEIIDEWATQISQLSGYAYNPESKKEDKEPVTV